MKNAVFVIITVIIFVISFLAGRKIGHAAYDSVKKMVMEHLDKPPAQIPD